MPICSKRIWPNCEGGLVDRWHRIPFSCKIWNLLNSGKTDLNVEIIKLNFNVLCGAKNLDFHKVRSPTIHTTLLRSKSMNFW